VQNCARLSLFNGLSSLFCNSIAPQAIEAVAPAVREPIGVLDKAVARSGYLVGDQLAFADVNLMPILHEMRLVPEGAETLTKAMHHASYYEQNAERPSLKSTIPPAGAPRRATEAASESP
jgi:glutathione S-transferase